MLELRHVGHSYPGTSRAALQDIDLQLQAGECLGLLGSNGAGKTTLLSLLSGVLGLQQGELRWEGQPRLGLVPQQLAFYAGLKVAENLELFADLYRLRGAERRQRLGAGIDPGGQHHAGDRGKGFGMGEQHAAIRHRDDIIVESARCDGFGVLFDEHGAPDRRNRRAAIASCTAAPRSLGAGADRGIAGDPALRDADDTHTLAIGEPQRRPRDATATQQPAETVGFQSHSGGGGNGPAVQPSPENHSSI